MPPAPHPLAELPRRTDSRADVEADRVRAERASSHLPSRSELVGLVARRFYHSTVYAIVYVTAIALNLVLLGWLVSLKGEKPDDFTSFVALEAFVTAALVVEVTVAMCSKGLVVFFAEATNVFDFFVMVLCVVSLASVHFHEERSGSLSITLFVTVLRYAAAALRLAALARLAHVKQKIPVIEQDRAIVDFDLVALERSGSVGSQGSAGGASASRPHDHQYRLTSSPRLFQANAAAGGGAGANGTSSSIGNRKLVEEDQVDLQDEETDEEVGFLPKRKVQAGAFDARRVEEGASSRKPPETAPARSSSGGG